MSRRIIQQSRIRIPGRTLVRNPGTGNPISCAWDDCQKYGYDEIKVVVSEPAGKKLHYIFCSDLHKRLHINGHHAYGKAAK